MFIGCLRLPYHSFFHLESKLMTTFYKFKEVKCMNQKILKNDSRNNSFIYFRNHANFSNLHFICTNLVKMGFYKNDIFLYNFFSKPVFWFRYDLSFDENISLKVALSLPNIPIFIYCYEPEEEKLFSFKRKNFVGTMLRNLKKKLSSININLLISHNSGIETIEMLAKKYKIANIIYSINTFTVLGKEKEKNVLNVITRLKIEPTIFTFDPLTMKLVYPPLKKKLKKFCKFFEEKTYLYGSYQKKDTLDTLNYQKMSEFKGTNYRTKKNENGVYNKESEKEFLKISSKKIEFDLFILKSAFSEFNYGFRTWFNFVRNINLNTSDLIQNIILKANLKVSFMIKKLLKMNFFSYI